MNITDNSKPKIHKIELAKRLYFLNHHINGLKKQRNKCADELQRNMFRKQIQELYDLKNSVILKMLKDGNAHIRYLQKDANVNSSYYIVRINREYSFHLPNTKEIKRILNEENNKEEIPQELRSE